jgi:hypothetical protein
MVGLLPLMGRENGTDKALDVSAAILPSLASRLPEHDIAANIRIAN